MSDMDNEEQPAAKRQKLAPEGEDAVIPDSEDELYGDDDDLEGADWDGGLLADEQDRAAESILSPSQQSFRVGSSQRVVGPASSPLKQVTTMQAVEEEDEDEAMLWQQTEQNGHDQTIMNEGAGAIDDDEHDFAAQEAELAARYGYNIDQLNLNQQVGPQTIGKQGNGFSFNSASFTSARGKSLAPPSEAALLKAQELHNRSSPEAANAEHTSADDSGFADTPLLSRNKSNLFAPASLVQSVGRNGSSAFKAPTINAESTSGVRPDLQPLRFGPKGGHTLLPARAPQTAHLPVKKATDLSDAFTSGSGARVSMPTKAQAEALMLRKEASATASEPEKAKETYPGLTLGGGGPFAMPSKAAIDKEKGKAVFGNGKDSETPEDRAASKSSSHASEAVPAQAAADVSNVGMGSKDNGILARQDYGGLTTGGGKAVAGPSAEAIARSKVALNKESMNTTSGIAGFTSSSGKAVSMPSEEAIQKAVSLLEQPNHETPSTPSRPALVNKDANSLSSVQDGLSTNYASPKSAYFKTPAAMTVLKKAFRLPSRVTANTTAPATPIRGSPAPGSQAARLALTQPRLNLEMAPRNTPSSAPNRGTFKTPFKNGHRPNEGQLRSLRKESMAKNIEPGTMLGVAPASIMKDVEEAKNTLTKKILKQGKDSVFDVYTKVPRKSMEEYGLNPCYRIDDLIDAGLPQDLIFLTFQKCEAYKFDKQFGYELAFEELAYYSDCKNITQDWVKNHYTLIVWKHAGIAKAKTDEWAKWWSFEQVCNQLKYRYEREILLTQRSCIKRIQERDSPASIPMILVVTQVIYEDRVIPPEPGSDEEIQGIVTTEPFASQLELSDGWYRIRTANLDESLYRGVWFGKIFSGVKIAIQGAKIDAGADGADPIEGLETSTLTVSGNSTSRAPWNAKLGFQRSRNICSFRSLLPDGGFVPFVDVVITRIYVRGFKGEYVEGASQDIWDEKEEADRKKIWEKEREKAQHDVQAEQNKVLHKLVELHRSLLSAVHAATSSKVKKEAILGLTDHEDVFNKLEDDPQKAHITLKLLDKELLEDTAAYAQRRIEAFSNDVAEHARREVDERCPPRVVKSFIIVRARDFHDRDPDNSRDCCLNITDPAKLGHGYLAENKRYVISNLYPSRPTSWSSPQSKSGEIFLSTRFDSKWQAMPL